MNPEFKVNRQNVWLHEESILKKLQSSVRLVTTVMFTFIILIIVCYTVAVIYQREYILTHNECEDKYTRDQLTIPYKAYAISHLVLSTLVTLWLVIITIIALVELKDKNTDDTMQSFVGEARRIKVIFITFIVAYGSWVVYDLINEFTGIFKANDYGRIIFTIMAPIVWDFIPILTVLFTHWRNTTSVNRIMKSQLQYHIAS